jgi:hypothetical protein
VLLKRIQYRHDLTVAPSVPTEGHNDLLSLGALQQFSVEPSERGEHPLRGLAAPRMNPQPFHLIPYRSSFCRLLGRLNRLIVTP